MREIKFRVWDKVDYMSAPFSLFDLQSGKTQFTKDVNIMQFTGLHDRNGKEIYEGDIVKQEKWVSVGKYANAIGVVNYKSTGFTVSCIGEWFGSNANLNGNAEIIGNIYENPELLTGEELKQKEGK